MVPQTPEDSCRQWPGGYSESYPEASNNRHSTTAARYDFFALAARKLGVKSGSGDATVWLRSRLLLRHPMECTESPDEIDCIDPDDDSIRVAILKLLRETQTAASRINWPEKAFGICHSFRILFFERLQQLIGLNGVGRAGCFAIRTDITFLPAGL